ncbi:hypothetical protein OGAPHI_006593 [Ogataea philodendri]|uniref:Large ribosomal subunit protein mL67 n=1 Tax=Ogataea philodendri TaxID=1378263 RepID=A0A9P8T091_9ASCO|nr:uncharacterized protein OGAPHI_006593 [Ogataea philodendri]KAH3661186.1 hypothetical protein OGAPHI_006593 [Ogataea philodendri]
MATRFRQPQWLAGNGFAPHVYLFRNIESGQVLYSQTPHITKYQIKQQSFRPNWENRKPSKRRDLWRPMAVAQFQSHETAVEAYNALVELKYMRQVTKRKEAEALRKRNQYEQIWYFGQYRPTWAQESVSDLNTVLDHFKLTSKIYWDSLWRKGDDKHWENLSVEHEELDKVNPREKFVVLSEVDQSWREETAQGAQKSAETQTAVPGGLLGLSLCVLLLALVQKLLVLFQGDLLLLLRVLVHAVERGVEHRVPHGEERLREVVLDSEMLVVDVVVDRVVGEQQLERIERERIPAMVVDGLERRERVQEDLLAWSQSCHQTGKPGSNGIQQEPFHGVVEQSTERVRHVQLVVARMEPSV